MLQKPSQDKLIDLRSRIETCNEEIDIPYHDALSRHFDRYARKNLDRDLTWYEMADPASIINTQSYITRRRLLVILNAMIDGTFRYFDLPLVVDFDGDLYVWNGHHRLYVARALGLREVKVLCMGMKE